MMNGRSTLRLPACAALVTLSAIVATSCDAIVRSGSNNGGSPSSNGSSMGSSPNGSSIGGSPAGTSCPNPFSMGGGYGAGGATVGSCTACGQPSDCPSPSSPCLVATCAAGCCDTAAVPAGTPCGADGGSAICDGQGACVPPCHTPSDCPAPGPCMATSCVGGACVTSVTIGEMCTAAVPQCCGGVCHDLTTDAANCGSCAHGCGRGVCEGSVCQEPVELACASTSVLCGPAMDATSLYWGDPATNEIMK